MNIDDNPLNHIFKPRDKSLGQWIIRRVNNDHFVIARTYQAEDFSQANKVHQAIYRSLMESDIEETKINLSITAHSALVILHTDTCDAVPDKYEVVARGIEDKIASFLPNKLRKRPIQRANIEEAN